MSGNGSHPIEFSRVVRKDPDTLAKELSGLDNILDCHGRAGLGIPISSLIPVVKAMARRIVELEDRLVRLQARVMTDEGDGR